MCYFFSSYFYRFFTFLCFFSQPQSGVHFFHTHKFCHTHFFAVLSLIMKILLSALNTRHTHSAIALAYIKSYMAKDSAIPEAEIKEFDINQTNEGIIAELILLKPDILAFSVYIWSINRVPAIIGAIKAALPETIIILGGPEVSFNCKELLEQHQSIDYIVRGEGEQTFYNLIKLISDGKDPGSLKGITWRSNRQIFHNPDAELIKDLDSIPSPFQNGIYKDVHSFTYYEASRGCPSRCSYCLSSVLGPVRNLSIERVKSDLDWFFKSNYRQVRFADRTFNFDKKRAREIISYIKANNHQNINFHFEIQADFLSEDILELLADAPHGMFHLEIGVQSTNPEALKAVKRRFDLPVLFERVAQLKARTGCHLHLDLLGALPCDTLNHFLKSLDDVWALNPHSIQISLVKVLRGTPLEADVKSGDLSPMPDPPYTILRTRWLSPEEAIRIQDIGKLVEGLYNCNRFPRSLEFAVTHFFNGSAGKMFSAMVDFWRENKILFYNFSPENICRQLADFISTLPNSIMPEPQMKKLFKSILFHELRMTQKVPGGENQSMPVFAPPLSKHTLRPEHGYKAFWYDFNPVEENHQQSTSPAPFPVVYLFERDLSATPDIQPIKLSLSEAFTFAAIQLRTPIDSLAATWQQTWPEISIPDFNQAIEKLLESGLLYEPASRRKPAENHDNQKSGG